MLKIRLVFWKSEPRYAYKRYAYKKNMYFNHGTSYSSCILLYSFQVFPPQFRELPGPSLDLFDLDESFSSEKARMAQITNKCEWTLPMCILVNHLYFWCPFITITLIATLFLNYVLLCQENSYWDLWDFLRENVINQLCINLEYLIF